MVAEHTRVAIVILPDFGRQLPSLAEPFHVWVVDTPVNRQAAEALWAAGPGDRTHGVTTFKLESESTESSIVNLLPVINEHHGLQEDWAMDIVLEVRGVPLTGAIRSALEALGRFDTLERPDGFAAITGACRLTAAAADKRAPMLCQHSTGSGTSSFYRRSRLSGRTELSEPRLMRRRASGLGASCAFARHARGRIAPADSANSRRSY